MSSIYRNSAITSQNGTAPKRFSLRVDSRLSAITSQNGTAPKHVTGILTQTLKCDYQSERHCSKTHTQP